MVVPVRQQAVAQALVWVAPLALVSQACWRPAVFRYRSRCLLTSLVIHQLGVSVAPQAVAAAVAGSG